MDPSGAPVWIQVYGRGVVVLEVILGDRGRGGGKATGDAANPLWPG